MGDKKKRNTWKDAINRNTTKLSRKREKKLKDKKQEPEKEK